MPYANEHACRLNDPGKYDRFARKNCEQKHDGKCIDVIYGIKNNKSEIQALRYPKKVWTAAAAKSHCSDAGGSFEAASSSDAGEPEMKVFELRDMKLDDAGKFRAVFSTFNVEDHQGDIVLPGAFGEQQVIISQYNHGSWERGADALPIGVGRIFEAGEEAIVEGEFDMEDEAAIKTYKKLKYLAAKGRVQEWSYALPEIDYEFRDVDGHRVRILKKIRVPEVSPVLMAASIGTRLLSIKDGKTEPVKLSDHIALMTEDVSALIGRLSKVASLRESQGDCVGEAAMQRVLILRAKLLEMVTEVDRIAKEHTAVERATLETLEIINRYRR